VLTADRPQLHLAQLNPGSVSMVETPGPGPGNRAAGLACPRIPAGRGRGLVPGPYRT